jgi:hypothetical protein
MAKYYGYGKCSYCEIVCTPGNYLDYKGKRYCTACWIQQENPDHPDLDAIREKVQNAVTFWKLAKYSPDEYHLPVGPKSINKR